MEHGSALVPLAELAERHLGLAPARAAEYAQRGALALPAIRVGRQKSPWLVHLRDLAGLIDAQRQGSTPA